MKKLTLLLIIVPLLVRTQQTSPTVCLDHGACYIGSWLESSYQYLCPPCHKFKYATFQGIKYAKAPIGDLRFKAPQPHYEEEGVYNVSEISYKRCPQFGMLDGLLVGQEDCLMLNIYIHESNLLNDDTQSKVPVMVYIHGGSLRSGSNNFYEYGPQHLIKKDVIVVTINYRLGALGFLSLGNSEVPGNAGLRDQVLALAWIRENIASFRGDPDSITIFGESSGAQSVSLHLVSPMSEGLFHRAIMQSGDALSGWMGLTQTHALQYGNMLSNAVGCGSAIQQLKCLQSINYQELVNKQDLIPGASLFYPVPENGFGSPEPFLPLDAEELMASGQFNTNVQVIIGTNNEEAIPNFMSVLADPSKWIDYRNNFNNITGPRLLFHIANISDITTTDLERTNKVIEYYLGSADNINEDHKHEMFQMLTDSGLLGTHKTIKYLTQYGVKTYQYILSYEGAKSFIQLFGLNPEGVSHADDLIYLFDPVLQQSSGYELVLGPIFGYDIGIREFMTSAWASFAKSGNPNYPDSGLDWQPQPQNDQIHHYWNMTYPPVMATSQDLQERLAFWENLMKNV